MKIDKQLQKEYISAIKEIAVKDGYKKIQQSIYKIKDENIIFIDYLIVNSKSLSYSSYIKKLSYDNIFWRIMRMEENLNKADSLRVIGSFAAPAILISEGDVELSENKDITVKLFWEKIHEEMNSFLERNDVTEYIFSGNIIVDEAILQCLSYIDSGLLHEAKKFAQKQILLGNTGRFENEGKGFFELVMLYND